MSIIAAHYASLSSAPCLPKTRAPSSLDHLRHATHKLYYQYLVTFSGYMLSNSERLLLDVFVSLILGILLWCCVLLAPITLGIAQALLGFAGVRALGKEELMLMGGLVGEEAVRTWAGSNGSLGVGGMGKGVARDMGMRAVEERVKGRGS